MTKGYTYISLYLFPVYINDSCSTNPNAIGIQKYNSSRWMYYDVNNHDLDNLYKLVRLSDEDSEEDPSNNYYSNFQLITDLFDIILTKQSEFRSKNFHDSVDYMLRSEGSIVDLTTDNRYTAEFSIFHPQNNAIILIANPASQNCRTLIKKRQRLNEYL